ncbi:FAD-dependent monooxygenase [Kitasatospora sp. NPDC057198]|uniref:FAD-dependent monooxygenase n=1 Tax=Kitasatospora sp. NPDC057198 TaxID=3346046 RepID=UPI003627EAE9
MDTEVIVVGAGPTGLMLACELRLAGVRPLLLERQAARRDTPKAGGIGGQVLELLRHRGLLERFEAACPGPAPAPKFPFGGIHLDLTELADPPLRALPLPQQRLEELLEERAAELGVEIRRGHRVTGIHQDGRRAGAEVLGPDGPYRVDAAYLVGCDGARSPVRDAAGIAFPGTAYPEVNRLAQVTLADTVTLHGNGDLDVPGLGTVRSGFTRTERGLLGVGAPPGSPVVSLYTAEEEDAEYDDDTPMTAAELQDSLRRVLGAGIPVRETVRLSRFTFKARHAEQYRKGRILLAGDAAHLFPATGTAINAGMLDAANLAWKLAADLHGRAPGGLLDSYQDERRSANARTMLHARAQVALRRGTDPAAEALRELLQELLTDEQPLRRTAALVAGADVRHPVPEPSGHHPMAGAFLPGPAGYGEAAAGPDGLLAAARPVLLDLADRADLRRAAAHWCSRVDVRTTAATAAGRTADAVLVRPDGHVAWAAAVGEPADRAAPALRAALAHWFGAPDRARRPEHA